MKISKIAWGLLVATCVLGMNASTAHSGQSAAPSTVQVSMVITDQSSTDNSEIPILSPEKVLVYQGKDPLRIKVDKLIPAKGDNAALQLFILIDDTLDPRIGTNLDEVRNFIKAQPASTSVGVAYMSNATFQITQNFTADHALAAKAVRLPRGILSTMDSPYLSLTSLVKAWPQQKVRREVLVLTDGIDRYRNRNSPSNFASMPNSSPDAGPASTISQRYGVIVHSIYAAGVGRLARNMWEIQIGQSDIARITDETGGEYFSVGTQAPISLKPFLDRLQSILDNQYYLLFQLTRGKKAGLQRVKISSEATNADIASADNVWVAGQ